MLGTLKMLKMLNMPSFLFSARKTFRFLPCLSVIRFLGFAIFQHKSKNGLSFAKAAFFLIQLSHVPPYKCGLASLGRFYQAE